MSDVEPTVALTFDAEHPDRPRCPAGNADRILDSLGSAGVRATFFIQGRWAQSNPETARRIGEEGHLIGNHSHYHARMPLLSDSGLDSDVTAAHDSIVATTGHDPRPWFRCPFGAGANDARVLAALRRLGYRDVRWHVELEDWEPWRTGDAIAADCVRGVAEHGDGSIVLLHTWPAGTGDAIGSIVTGLRDLGTTFVTVDELGELP